MRVRSLKVGAPEDPATDISPVASDLAVAPPQRCSSGGGGAERGQGPGGRPDRRATWSHPTVLRDATDDMLGMREEVFGPLAFTTSFATTGRGARPGPGP